MAKKDYKQAGKNIAGEIKQRGISEFLGRVNNVLSNTSNNVLKFVPAPIRSFLPFIAHELDIKAPTADGLFNKLTVKSESQLEAAREDLESRETAILQQISDEIKKEYPPLKTGKEITGNRGRYQIKEFLDKFTQFTQDSLADRQARYFYQAIELPDSEPIIIEEFLFPKAENERNNQKRAEIEEKIKYIQYNFERISGLILADGRIQDFRLITPDEAIFDHEEKRYYLVFKNTFYHGHSLGSYIRENGAMSNVEVYQVLNQVLQSLQFLHTQKFLLPSGSENKKKYHGNLSLDTLVIVPSLQGFLIYLRDLSLWEHQYNDVWKNQDSEDTVKIKCKKDVQDLGKIGFALLAGKEANNITDLKLPNTVNDELKEFLFKLISNEFSSAEKARQSLPNLQNIARESKSDKDDQEDEKTSNNTINFHTWQLILLGSCGILLLFIGIFWLLNINKSRQDNQNQTLKSLDKIVAIPQGKFVYSCLKEADVIWRYVLTTEKLLPGGESLEKNLGRLLPSVELDYDKPTQLDNITRLKNGEIDFAISTIVNNNKNSELGYEEFAYDGLVVFVAFSKEGRQDSLPTALEGKITLEQLQKIYTGEITNWRDVTGINGPNLKIKLYISRNAEAVGNFEQRVLKTEENISRFRRLLTAKEKNDIPKVSQLETFETFRSIIKDFENVDSKNVRIGGIGFDFLSKTYGQCSIYPLALQHENKYVVSPLIQLNGKPINPRETDLCNKSSYVPNSRQFINQSYPLAYPLSVVYLRDNRQEPKGKKFGEVLQSKEVQCLLKHTGLVTLQPLKSSEDCQISK
ncbi:substrate-binding domain-containing protein [Anabaena sp. FACHB-1237]|uniref:PstS family phosphate ABC transporter substrate-binding protein n=1 Tax=Anabaena sp. FACHB-1237 TaxID=2692769 RepID=UPI00168008B4|nr:substrate-binding domain-containing protein [Anabaena sp. FACHB-1237]MBD2137988.1 substrate-binding domain-containing protein [Anabaena sp. FACHB-1237]